MKTARKYEMDLTEGSVLGKVIRYSIPLIFTTLLQLLYNAADTVVVGRFSGDTALAAVGSTGSLTMLIVNLFFGLSVGANVVVSQYYGAKDDENVSKAVHTSIATSIICGVVLAVIGVVFAKGLLVMMSSPENVIDEAALYMKIYFLGMPGNLAYNFGAGILRAAGDTKRPLYILSLTGLVNVGLNLLLVIVFHMGVAGVAIATIVSQYLSAYYILRCLAKSDSSIRFEWKKMSIDGNALKKIVRIGLPAGVQGSIFSISNVLIQSTINSFGSVVIAGNSAAANIEGFIAAASNAIYSSCLSFVGQNVGAGKYNRVKRIVVVCMLMTLVTTTAVGVGAYLCGRTLLGLYTTSTGVVNIGIVRLSIIGTTHALAGMMDVMSGALRGIGNSMISMVGSVTGVCGVRLTWIFTIFKMNPTLEMLYVAYPISWTVTLAVHIICFTYFYRKMMRRAAEKGLLSA